MNTLMQRRILNSAEESKLQKTKSINDETSGGLGSRKKRKLCEASNNEFKQPHTRTRNQRRETDGQIAT